MARNSISSKIRQQSPVAELVVSEPPLEGHVLWVDITEVDRAQSYTLGKLTLESQTVIELFQQCVFSRIIC